MVERELFMPPGFRFHPTDWEVTISYLLQKSLNPSFAPLAIGEVSLNKCEPWDLPSKAKMGEKEWYFFCQKDMRYSTGRRANRATEKGYWKATGRDREIFMPASSSASAAGRELVGMRKTLVFYMGRAPQGTKTNWVMHEFRLEGKYRHNASPKDEWVVCKVFHKNNGEDNKATVEPSVGTPNFGPISVDGTDDVDDFIDSIIDLSSLTDLTTMDAGAVVVTYDAADYSIACTAAAAAATTTSSFVDLPNYTFSDTTSRKLNQAAVVDNSADTTSSSSWNLLHAGQHPMGSYNLHDQAMMARSTGGAIFTSFADAVLPSSLDTGISQHNDYK